MIKLSYDMSSIQIIYSNILIKVIVEHMLIESNTQHNSDLNLFIKLID